MWSYDAFLAEGDALVARAQRLRTNESAVWEWRHGARPHLVGNAYLVSTANPRPRRPAANASKELKASPTTSSAIDDINALVVVQGDDDMVEEELKDVASLSTVDGANGDNNDVVLYEFHIVFHAVYQTPALYFRITRVDGAPVSWDAAFARDLKLPGGNERATLVAMDDHPVLGTPFYFLHPCETASAMALLLDQPTPNRPSTGLTKEIDGSMDQEKKSASAETPPYLLAWLSLVQPLTGIDPLTY